MKTRTELEREVINERLELIEEMIKEQIRNDRFEDIIIHGCTNKYAFELSTGLKAAGYKIEIKLTINPALCDLIIKLK